MIKTKALSTCIKLGFVGILCSPFFLAAKPATLFFENDIKLSIPDSIGSEVVNGEIYIIHRVEPKDTYYALGRRYAAPVNGIMSANNKKSLKPGDTVKVPTGRRANSIPTAQVSPQASPTISNQPDPQEILTEYKVGKSETLFAISRRFDTTVDEIKRMNGLTSNSVKEGQLLKIPNSDYHEPEPEIEIESLIDTPSIADQHTVDLGLEANRYGIREKQEKGIGVWMENLETDGKSNLALHKTAPIGTILKITNPMTRNVTYAKVVGKFTDNTDTQGAIVVLSKSAASYIGALDRRFLIEIAYGVPLQ